MKIEKNKAGNGYVLTNQLGESLNVSFAEFWDICRTGNEIDVKSEVEAYLAQCPEIKGHDLDRLRAFPGLVNTITARVIQDRIDSENGDQIFDAAEKCISSHIASVESKIKWFKISNNKCISVWYAPDKYDGDQFQMHLEEIGEDGKVGPGCRVLSDESYATSDISFKALCETLSEIYLDAGIDEEDAGVFSVDGIVSKMFAEFGMDPTGIVHQGDRELFDGSFKYWSNACGDLHYHGEYDITQDELPEPLRRAYNEIWSENYESYCYLVETKNGYGIALINEYDTYTAEKKNCTMDELFSAVQADKEKIISTAEFKNASVYAGDYTGFDGCHELIVVFPADTPVEEFTDATLALESIAYSSDVVREKASLDIVIRDVESLNASKNNQFDVSVKEKMPETER